MDKEKKHLLMGLRMTEILKKARKMAQESSQELMEVTIKVIGPMTSFMEKGSLFGQTETNTMDSGKKVKCTEQVSSTGQMEESTMVNT